MKPLYILFSLVITCTASAQSSPVNVRLHLEDGSIIRCRVNTTSIPVETAYGVLTIPLSEVRSIQFRIHPSIEEQASIDAAAKMLGSAIHKEREHASKLLPSFGRNALPSLWISSKDAEFTARAKLIVKTITDADSREALEFDMVRTAKFPIEGKIKLEEMTFSSKALGDIKLPIGELESLRVFGTTDAFVALDAAMYGNDLSLWKKTGIDVSPGESLNVNAEGQVELFPATPGLYLCTPKGCTTMGRGGQFMAGSLVGRIGQGPPFYVGEALESTAKEEGELQLMVTPSPWGNAITGEYKVSIKVSR